jgi:hypothetical protein
MENDTTDDLGLSARHTVIEDPEIIEYEDMTDEQKRIVDAGNTIAGTFPTRLTRDELSAWMKETFGW